MVFLSKILCDLVINNSKKNKQAMTHQNINAKLYKTHSLIEIRFIYKN